MGKKVKVINHNDYHVGVSFISGVSRDVPPHTVLLVDEDDVFNWAASTSLFTGKHLTLLDEEAVDSLGLDREAVAWETDGQIAERLTKGSLAALRKYLEGITEIHIANRVRAVAQQCDLKTSKMALVDELLGALTE